MMRCTIKNLIQEKIDRHNKAEDRLDTSQARQLMSELRGMQQLLGAMGIDLDFGLDENCHTTYTLKFV